MGMVAKDEKDRVVSEINVTPMVDVMLVLLIIFMVIAPMLQPRVRVAVPKGKNPDLDLKIDRETSVVLAAPEEGEYFLNREKVPPDRIQDRIVALLENKPVEERVVYIKSGSTVRYGTVVALVDAVRSARCDRIGLVAEKESAR